MGHAEGVSKDASSPLLSHQRQAQEAWEAGRGYMSWAEWNSATRMWEELVA